MGADSGVAVLKTPESSEISCCSDGRLGSAMKRKLFSPRGPGGSKE
jgi:hypothetical protein